MKSDDAVTLSHVTKSFKLHSQRRTTLKERIVRGKPDRPQTFNALNDVSFAVPKGSMFALVGHNGSGKSTALKVISGIYRPTEGHINIQGRLASLIELGAGFHPDLTGRENIQLNGTILGLSRKEIAASSDEIIEFSGLSDFIDEPVKHYSSGMYVRLGFSVAVHMKPDVLLVDEVLAVGDEEFQKKCMSHLQSIRKQGSTIIVVTHSLGVVEALCDEAILLERGRLIADGTPKDVCRLYLNRVRSKDRVVGPGTESLAVTSGVERFEQAPIEHVQITNFHLVTADGQVRHEGITGEILNLNFSYTLPHEVLDAVLLAEVRHEDGAAFALFDARESRQVLGDRFHFGEFSCELQRGTLAPGNYSIRISVMDAGMKRTIAESTSEIEFLIRPSDTLIESGRFKVSSTLRNHMLGSVDD